jgi:membrane-associated protein
MPWSVDAIVASGGILAIALIVFAESGLLLGFFLPGDTLLVAAGIFAAQGTMPLEILLPTVTLAAIAGYQLGYVIGLRAGPRFFNRQGGVLFRQEYTHRAQAFFGKHGGKAIVLARFVAVIRTVVPVLAGVGKMSAREFTFYNITGALVWVVGLILGSYWLGSRFPNLDKIILPMLLAAIILTVGSLLWKLGSTAQKRRELGAAIAEEFSYLFGKKK